jgi:glucosyl-3-phosphoglycerate synthase
LQIARDAIIRYEGDAALNDLEFDRHAESLCVESFASGINRAGKLFWQNPSAMQLIPSWHRVTAALPGIFQELQEAVVKDNK